jgi:hypothetical protein
MTKRSHIVALAAVFALTGVSVIVAAQQRPNRVSDQQVADLLSRLDTGIAAFAPISIRRSIGTGLMAAEQKTTLTKL